MIPILFDMIMGYVNNGIPGLNFCDIMNLNNGVELNTFFDVSRMNGSESTIGNDVNIPVLMNKKGEGNNRKRFRGIKAA